MYTDILNRYVNSYTICFPQASLNIINYHPKQLTSPFPATQSVDELARISLKL